MTFEEFQATRKPADLTDMYAAERTPNEQAHGLLYAGSLFIESTEGWETKAEGKWYLIVERDEYISDDLEELERILYKWGIDAGNLQASCALCRALIGPGEGILYHDAILCSESCRQEAEENIVMDLEELPLPEDEFQALLKRVRTGELKIKDIVVPPPTKEKP